MPHISFASITQRNSNTKLTALAESSLKAAKEAHRVQKAEAELGVGLKISRMENVNSVCAAHECVRVCVCVPHVARMELPGNQFILRVVS